MKKDQVKSALLAAFFEALFVVLAVILAIAAENWREAKKEEREAQQALAAILEEIESNRDLVKESRAYHEGRMQAAYAALQAGESLTSRDFPRGFLNSASVSTTAWEVAKVTGAIGQLDYATILELSQVYEAQSSYEIQQQVAGELIYTTIWETGTESIPANLGSLASVIATFVYREDQLVAAYEEALATLRVAESGE